MGDNGIIDQQNKEEEGPICYINGIRHKLPLGRAEATLLSYLRDNGLTGAKLGCGEGGCGACTVMVSSYDHASESLTHKSVNACLCPLYSVEGMHVITVEGIGSTRKGLHPVQKAIASAHGSQCGACTPGFVMSMYALLRSKNGAKIIEEEIEENLAGNLCRCTGYRPILDAFRPFTKSDPSIYTEETLVAAQKEFPMNRNNQDAITGSSVKVCPSSGLPCDCKAELPDNGQCDRSTFGPNHGVEPIFPPELKKRPYQELSLLGPVASWYRPLTLVRMLDLKRSYPEAKIVCGNTEVGIETKFKNAVYPVLVCPSHVPELNCVVVRENSVTLGSAVSLTKLLKTCKDLCQKLPKFQTSGLKAIAEQLKWFAGPPIRNAASLGGNICTASPISDLNPLWIAIGATFEICSIHNTNGKTTVNDATINKRIVPASSFFLGYRKVDLGPAEILTAVHIPFTQNFEYVKEFKQARRRDDDIAIVNAGIRIRMENKNLHQAGKGNKTSDSKNDCSWIIADAALSFGGVAPLTVTAPKTANNIIGKALNQETLSLALDTLKKDINIHDKAPGGMVEYRRALASSFLFKAIIYAANSLEEDSRESDPSSSYLFPWEDSDKSAIMQYFRPASRGLQYFDKSGDKNVVGVPYAHNAAEMQASGEAIYVDDIPLPPHTLHGALVLSDRPHAKILNIDTTKALEVENVVQIFTAKDIPGGNDIGPVIHDEELFASDIVTCVGQCIGIVVAETEQAAKLGAQSVKISYEDLPAILSIQDAIENSSYYDEWGHEVISGDVDAVFSQIKEEGSSSYHFHEADVRIGGQEHFYLEPNSHLVIPGEGDEILSFSSTQCPDKHQKYIAHVLGIAQHKVVVRTKRLGGGFGGKETRAAWVNASAAVPAFLLNRPVRLTLDRDVDMATTGQRHPFLAKYRIAFDCEGIIHAFDVHLYSNAGNSLDLSASVMDRALMHADNVYRIPNFRAKGHVCRSNLPSNTAFRGFGGPQGMHVIENAIDFIAQTIGKNPEEIRILNMYNDGDLAPYNQVLDGCQARTCWEGVVGSYADIAERRVSINHFNAQNRYRKRGLAILPTKFGISFTTKFLNQAGALVHIYHVDGTILVTHGGVEMGQGLHTKVCQIVAEALGVPMKDVHIAETSTDKVPNASPTAASASSDMYGAAAANACAQLNARLAPFKSKLPNASFKEIVQAAYFERVDLSAHGFYATPDITGFGGDRPFNYLTYGAAATEVELDVLSGDWQIIRTDIVMDVGKSINPAIDIGQIEGAFVQGMGWSCIEELVWGDREHPWVRPGWLHTRGPGAYKIPTANDIPIDFRVTLLRDAPCAQTPLVHSSKAVGEPPFFLGTSVFWALKDAVYASRVDAGCTGWFQLDLPASSERLRMAVSDNIAEEYCGKHFRPKLSA